MLERVKLNNVRVDRFRMEGTTGVLMKFVSCDDTLIRYSTALCNAVKCYANIPNPVEGC